MDLMNAKKQAKGQSLVSNHAKVYVIVDEQTGECSVNLAPLRGRMHAFQDGQEVEVSNEKFIKEKIKEVKQNNKKLDGMTQITPVKKETMETKTAPAKVAKVATPAKKEVAPSKKVVAKKVTKKEVKKVAKKTPTKSAKKASADAPRGAYKSHTVKEVRKLMAAGEVLYWERGSRVKPSGIAKMKDPDREIMVAIGK